MQSIDWGIFWTAIIGALATLCAAFGGSFMTYKLYEKEKQDNYMKEHVLKEEEKVKNLNMLLIQLLECIDNTLLNLQRVEEQKDSHMSNYKGILAYAVRRNCDLGMINNAIRHFIIELPGVIYNLNSLSRMLEWVETYRNRRNELIRKKVNNGEKYQRQVEFELHWNKNIIELIIPCLLVIYDFAMFNFGDKYTILKITEKDILKDAWKYLPEDFKKVDIESTLQYKIKSNAIIKWFFDKLKKEYEKENEQLNEAALTK